MLNGCPHLTTGAISDSFVNHKLQSSLLETAILIREMTMKSLSPGSLPRLLLLR